MISPLRSIDVSRMFVPLFRSLILEQRNKNEKSGTSSGTSAECVSLKVLAFKALERNKQRNKCGTNTQKRVEQNTPSCSTSVSQQPTAASEPPAVPTQFCFREYFPILSCIQNARGFTIDFEAEGIILYVNRWNKSYVDNGAYDWLEGQSARLIAECTALHPSLAKANIPANSVRVEVVPDDKSLPCTGYPSLLHFLWTMFEASELLANPTSNELRLSDKAAALCADYWKEYYRREDDPFFA